MTDEEIVTIDQADRILRADYWGDVRGVADELRELILDPDEIDDEEAADTWLNETVDGHELVIYTHQAMQCLLYSGNDGAYGEEFGAEGMVEDGCIMWSRLAYAAFMADIRETIDVAQVFEEREEARAKTAEEGEVEEKEESNEKED